MASIRGSRTANFIRNLVSGRSVWTGGYKIQEDGLLAWTDSNPWDSSASSLLADGEPNGSNEFCVGQFGNNLKDVKCEYKKRFVCQKDPKPM